jgi:hypothetical protein
VPGASTRRQPDADPRLGPLQRHGGPTEGHLPLLGSAAIDARSCGDAACVDQRGRARLDGTACDAGAVESSAVARETTMNELRTLAGQLDVAVSSRGRDPHRHRAPVAEGTTTAWNRARRDRRDACGRGEREPGDDGLRPRRRGVPGVRLPRGARALRDDVSAAAALARQGGVLVGFRDGINVVETGKPHNRRASVRVRITQRLSGSIDGIQLDQFTPGYVYDVGTSLGSYLLAIDAVEPVADDTPALILPLGQRLFGPPPVRLPPLRGAAETARKVGGAVTPFPADKAAEHPGQPSAPKRASGAAPLGTTAPRVSRKRRKNRGYAVRPKGT